MARILLVDDDASALLALKPLLVAEGYEVATASDGVEALALADELPPDLVLTDLDMPRMDGIALLFALRQREQPVPVVVMTASADLAPAVTAMRAGAEDYLPKPLDLDALLLVVERALARRAEKLETESLRQQLRERDQLGLKGLVGTSPAMQRVYRMARQVAPSRATVLVTGESGTGKGELANAIHALGPRAGKPFVALHCAALSESLLESELFGHERGAFTGAERRRAGSFEQANGGTLFLDEVGEIPPLTQVKLLRVLQERAFERVGGNETIQVDVRVIAATNRDLAADVQSGRFREDLFYRLNVVHVEMPPLRLRGLDALTLAEHFLRRFAVENHKRVDGFTDEARAKLRGHRFPGNVRELENAIERAVVLCQGTTVEAEDLPFDTASDGFGPLRIPGSTMAEVERFTIMRTLEACAGSTSRAAELLGISVRTIQYRLHEYGVARPPSGTQRSVACASTPQDVRAAGDAH